MSKRRIRAYVRKPRNYDNLAIIIVGIAILVFGMYLVKIIGVWDMREPKNPQDYIWDYTKNNKTKIAKSVYDNLNKENYWLVWTDEGKNLVWNYENNIGNGIPDKEYEYINRILSNAGYLYVFDI